MPCDATKQLGDGTDGTVSISELLDGTVSKRASCLAGDGVQDVLRSASCLLGSCVGRRRSLTSRHAKLQWVSLCLVWDITMRSTAELVNDVWRAGMYVLGAFGSRFRRSWPARLNVFVEDRQNATLKRSLKGPGPRPHVRSGSP